jgi:heavy metal efflux system protein
MATGVGSDVQRSLATVVAGGLMMATLMTLFLLPTFYYVIERIAARRAGSPVATAAALPADQSP